MNCQYCEHVHIYGIGENGPSWDGVFENLATEMIMPQ
jgi:hypothetical protein